MAGMNDYRHFSQFEGELENGGHHYGYPGILTSSHPSEHHFYQPPPSGIKNQGNTPAASHSYSTEFHRGRGELQLNLNKGDLTSQTSRDSSPEDSQSFTRFTNSSSRNGDKGAGIITIFADNILSHPFLVLRRQCQVHTCGYRYHLTPFTLISPIFHICKGQGCGVLWKGIGSSLLIRGMTMFIEDFTSKVSNLPKEITRHSPIKAVCQHLLLKAISLTIVTPFYSASLTETVQSDVVLSASEGSGILDVFREGFWRILSWPNATGRLVPLHVLILPTVAHGLLSYLIYSGIKSISLSTLKRVRQSQERKKGALSKNSSVSYYVEMTASLIGHATSDILLFPLETVLHRLHLQGTRAIIDNLDCGIDVTPVTTSYLGVLDCVRTIIEEEGVGGMYKGFGALVLQYGLQILLIRLVKIVLEKNPFGGTQPPRVEIDGNGTGAQPFHSSEAMSLSASRRHSTSGIHPPSRQYSRSFTPTGMSAMAGFTTAANDDNTNHELRYRSRFGNYGMET